MARLISLGMMICWAGALSAQHVDSLPIDTDRPDFTDGVHTVAPGRLQFETGYTYQRDRQNGVVHSFPELLIRTGLSHWLELRVADNYLNDRGQQPPVSGFDDLYLGSKFVVRDQHGWVPALSGEAKVNLPTGSNGISAGRVLPGGALLLGWEGDGPWSAGVELFLSATGTQGSQRVASLSIQYQAIPALQLFGEGYTVGQTDQAAQHYLDAGALLLLSRNLQADARIGIGINHAASQFFAGVGLSLRR